MAETVLVAGTASHVGKSTIAAGLCRSLAKTGVSVAPFKAQNMSNNARVAVSPAGEWGEIGVSQYVQARAAGVAPTTDVNPVLLKPRGEGESQLVVHGKAIDNVGASEYYEDHWERAREAVVESYRRLETEYEVIVAEGAGSIAEINLHDRDLANVETAEIANAEVLVVVDIERGGAFASLYGTLELLPDRLRDRVVGAIVNKFRGDVSLLKPGLKELEARTGIPILGVVPYDDPGLPEEDSVSLPAQDVCEIFGEDDGVPDRQSVTVAVPRLPRISNATDLEPLMDVPGVRVRYTPLDASLGGADAVVLPGSKNTVDDLIALEDAGIGEELRRFDGPIVGLCGGYQMLGERIIAAGIESTKDVDVVEGIGLLPVETRFSSDKRVERVRRRIDGVGPLAEASGTVTGYEIHMGRSRPFDGVERPIGPESAATGQVVGTYLHGLFENETVRTAFVESIFDAAGKSQPPRKLTGSYRSSYDRAADLIEEHVDLSKTTIETSHYYNRRTL